MSAIQTSNRIGVHTRMSDRPFLGFLPLLDSLIERLKHARVHGGDHIDRGIQLFFGHPRFPCVRKAAIHSGIAEPHRRDREADEHLLALAKALDGMRISVECPKVGFCHAVVPHTKGHRAPCSRIRNLRPQHS